jgi:hypothetical protein
MSSLNERIFCDFNQCPIKDKCNNYRPVIIKEKRLHWGIYPYPFKNKDGDCIGYEPKDIEGFNELNITSNGS